MAIEDGAIGLWSALEEVYPDARQQRCWVHKTASVLNCFPKSSQPKAKDRLHDIWRAETKEEAVCAFDPFVEMYEVKYPKAMESLEKDRGALLAFYNFPAQHWRSIRTTNPIEFAGTIRRRTKRCKGCLKPKRNATLHMIFKLGVCAEKNWGKLRGFSYLGKVITGVKFKNGIEVSTENQQVACSFPHTRCVVGSMVRKGEGLGGIHRERFFHFANWKLCAWQSQNSDLRMVRAVT